MQFDTTQICKYASSSILLHSAQAALRWVSDHSHEWGECRTRLCDRKLLGVSSRHHSCPSAGRAFGIPQLRCQHHNSVATGHADSDTTAHQPPTPKQRLASRSHQTRRVCGQETPPQWLTPGLSASAWAGLVAELPRTDMSRQPRWCDGAGERRDGPAAAVELEVAMGGGGGGGGSHVTSHGTADRLGEMGRWGRCWHRSGEAGTCHLSDSSGRLGDNSDGRPSDLLAQRNRSTDKPGLRHPVSRHPVHRRLASGRLDSRHAPPRCRHL